MTLRGRTDVICGCLKFPRWCSYTVPIETFCWQLQKISQAQNVDQCKVYLSSRRSTHIHQYSLPNHFHLGYSLPCLLQLNPCRSLVRFWSSFNFSSRAFLSSGFLEFALFGAGDDILGNSDGSSVVQAKRSRANTA